MGDWKRDIIIDDVIIERMVAVVDNPRNRFYPLRSIEDGSRIQVHENVLMELLGKPIVR